MTTADTLYSQADILIVDDNPVNVELLLDLLEDEGYENVEGITDPTTVHARVQRQTPDLMLLDVRMPHISGLELLVQLKETMGEKAPATIILAAQIDEQTKHQALGLGAQDYLTKPFNHTEVIQRISNTLQLQYMLQERSKQLITLSRQDPVTSLPNRPVILECLSTLQGKGVELTVYFIAFEGLDEITRLHGYEIADQTSQTLAKIIQSINDIPMRLLGVWSTDRWVVICESKAKNAEVKAISQRLLQAIRQPIKLHQLTLFVQARVGVSAAYPSRTAEQTIRMAAVALPSADNSWQGYTQDIEDQLLRRTQLRDALHQALDRDEFHLLYQPKICVNTGNIEGVEALLRWECPTLGRISPIEFIPVAEANGNIIPIGKWVIEQSLSSIKQWGEQGLVNDSFSIAVNVASSQLMQPDFADWVIQTVNDWQLPAHVLELEVTESSLMQDMQLAMQQLNTLAKAGVHLAIDDFGTGYSSLSYLKDLPVSVIKIDRTFIREMHNNPKDQGLTSTVIDMARHFNFKTVAEGVEEPEQLALLRKMGCDLMQGFMFAPPLNESALLRLLPVGFNV